MSEAFAQPERRSFLLPMLLAAAALAIIAVITVRLYPATKVQATHLQTSIHSEDTVFKSNSIVLGSDRTEHVLYIASTVRIDNQLRVPVTLNTFTLTFINPDGAQLTAKSLTRSELANLEVTYPALKPLVVAPLFTDATLTPAVAIQGTLLFALSIPQSMWSQRKSAVVEISLYHQPSVFLPIPLTNN